MQLSQIGVGSINGGILMCQILVVGIVQLAKSLGIRAAKKVIFRMEVRHSLSAGWEIYEVI